MMVRQRNELTVYSDGSVIPYKQQGTYAWIAGYHDAKGKLQILLEGGGTEHETENTTRGELNSTRMEAYGRLRAQPIIRQHWTGPVTHWIDNKATVWRMSNNKNTTRSAMWKSPDEDIWNQIHNQKEKYWTPKWVKAHADKSKKKDEITQQEAGNIIADGKANDQYQTPTNHDKPWEENITEGTIYLGGTNHKHRLVSKNTTTILSYLRDLTTRHRIEQQYKQMQKAHPNVDFSTLDLDLQNKLEKAEKRIGTLARNVKLVGIMLATNERLYQRAKGDGKCEMCGKHRESQNHIMGHCTHPDIVAQRKRLIQKIHHIIDDKLGEIMPSEHWQIIQQIWTEESLQAAYDNKGTSTKHTYHWDDLDQMGKAGKYMKQHMEQLTKPGAALMWQGWFTTHWAKGIMEIANENSAKPKPAQHWKTALSTAKALRTAIMDCQYDIWKTRNEIKHQVTNKGTLTRAGIEQIMAERKEHNITTIASTEDIINWTKSKQHKWKKQSEKRIEKAKLKRTRNLRLFNNQGWKDKYNFTMTYKPTNQNDSNKTKTQTTQDQEAPQQTRHTSQINTKTKQRETDQSKQQKTLTKPETVNKSINTSKEQTRGLKRNISTVTYSQTSITQYTHELQTKDKHIQTNKKTQQTINSKTNQTKTQKRKRNTENSNEITQAQTKKTKKKTEGKKKTKKKTKKKIVTADTSPPTVHTDPRRTPKDAEGIG